MSTESSAGLREKSVGLRGDWIASITNVAPTAATTLTMAALIAASGLASPLALLVAGAAMLCLKEFLLGLLLPLVGAATLVYVIVKSLPGTPVPIRIIALVLFLVGIPLAFLSKAITRAPFFATRRERATRKTRLSCACLLLVLRSDAWLGGDDEVAAQPPGGAGACAGGRRGQRSGAGHR